MIAIHLHVQDYSYENMSLDVLCLRYLLVLDHPSGNTLRAQALGPAVGCGGSSGIGM